VKPVHLSGAPSNFGEGDVVEKAGLAVWKSLEFSEEDCSLEFDMGTG
jgi:hypothetical protein